MRRSRNSGAITRNAHAGQSSQTLSFLPPGSCARGARSPYDSTGVSGPNNRAMKTLAELSERHQPRDGRVGIGPGDHRRVANDDEKAMLPAHRDAEPVVQQ